MSIGGADSRTWKRGAAVVFWLAAIIAPAFTFDIAMSYSSDIDVQFGAFFLIMMTVLYLVVASSRPMSNKAFLPLWIVLAGGSFVGFALMRQHWTCDYYGKVHIVTGTDFTVPGRAYLKQHGIAPDDCLQILSPFGGDARKIWSESEVTQRFLLLFGAYSLAWMMLAACVVSAVKAASRKRQG